MSQQSSGGLDGLTTYYRHVKAQIKKRIRLFKLTPFSTKRWLNILINGAYLSSKQIRENLDQVNQNLGKKDPETGYDGRHEHYQKN